MLATRAQQHGCVRFRVNRRLLAVAWRLLQYWPHGAVFLCAIFVNPPRCSHFYLCELVDGKKEGKTSLQIALIQSIDFSVKGAAVALRSAH